MMTDPSERRRLAQALDRRRADLRGAIDANAPRATLEAATARLHEARRALREADGLPSAPGVPVPTLPSTLTGHLFGSPVDAQRLRASSVRVASGPSVGVCLSGGGTRAASCSMGALRALQQLGLLDHVQLLSTVSGGGWAGSIYMYSAAPLSETLGPVVPDDALGQLRWSSGAAPFDLSQLGDRAIGRFCTRIGWDALVEGATSLFWDFGERLSVHAYWPRLIGRLVLEPYGLGDHVDTQGAPTRWYSGPEGLFPLVIAPLDPELSASSFYFSQAERPWWVANSTFNAPGSQAPFPFWHSELDVGIYPRFPGLGIAGTDLGGGGIDPFTFGTKAPLSYGDGRFTAATPPGQYALSDAVGTSSAAFGVELFSRLPAWLRTLIGDITPEYPYWPPSSPQQPAQIYQLSDGAGLDNSAVCGMLGWSGVQSILSFVSTDVPLEVDDTRLLGDIDAVRMDASIPALFGWIWDAHIRGYRKVVASDGNPFYVQAFDPAGFTPLVDGLRAAVATGGAALAKVSTTTVDNPRFGIAAGRSIDVLFVFNHRAPSFWDALEREIHWGLDLQFPFVTFPYFDTLRDLSLTAQAVNLLADLMAWSVTTNEGLVRSMFGRIT